MENDGNVIDSNDDNTRSAVNSLILDYYKKFGKKRDLEQYFSLSTAQSDIRDPKSLFWRRMKVQTSSSDSGDKNNEESSTELCRISIKCSMPTTEPSSSQDEDHKVKEDSVSPPIITEYLEPLGTDKNSDNESVKSDDNRSLKSADLTLDTSAYKPVSPTSSINSQRKLEWDSLADVGYANEGDMKTSSSLSTLERLALKQQYSNNDSKHDTDLGLPTAQSTPVDLNDPKNKCKKSIGKKTTRFYEKATDKIEVNVPYSSDSHQSQPINVNLNKHISFNVDKNGGVSFENIKQNVNVKPENITVETKMTPKLKIDKEIQTTLKEKSFSSNDLQNSATQSRKSIPVMINLNTLRRRNRIKRIRSVKKKLKMKKTKSGKESVPALEKSGEPISEAESFEYMPGHIYNQNNLMKLQQHEGGPSNTVGNKSSLESSAGLTTDSSKGSKHSFTKDLEKSIDLLKIVLQQRFNDSSHKKNLIKEVVQRLVKSKYRDDESTTDFLSGLSFKIEGSNYTTTSTSDNTTSADKSLRPKKSILRTDKRHSDAVASTSQSAPNLPSGSRSSKSIQQKITFSNSETDESSKGKVSSDNTLPKTSSEELYQKYIKALQREQVYKKHLKENEIFIKKKMSIPDTQLRHNKISDLKSNNKLNELLNDLTRNNYDDGSGDASKLEGGSSSNIDLERYKVVRSQRSHSVFTLSSSNEKQNKKVNLKKKSQKEVKESPRAGCSKNDPCYCCCPYHSTNRNVGFTDSSVQVNIKCNDNETNRECQLSPRCSETRPEQPVNLAQVAVNSVSGATKFVCLCTDETIPKEMPRKFLLYKCSELTDRGVPSDDKSVVINTMDVQSANLNDSIKNSNTLLSHENRIQNKYTGICDNSDSDYIPLKRMSRSSQTNINLTLNAFQRGSSEKSVSSWSSEDKKIRDISLERHLSDPFPDEESKSQSSNKVILILESTRWIQTEISIDPKISNPSLSDINIVSDSDCVKLVHERLKQISKPSNTTSSDQSKAKSDRQALYDISSLEYTSVPKDPSVTQVKINETSDVFQNQILNKQLHSSRVRDNAAENFTIPIQGTNMTLMVKVNPNLQKNPLMKNIEMVNQGIVTDKFDLIDKATCLREECSKAVQSESTYIFATLYDNASSNARNSFQYENKANKETESSQKDNNVMPFKTSYVTNTCRSIERPQYNTYPKIIHDPKPFLRTNSDSEYLNTKYFIKTDTTPNLEIEKKDNKAVKSNTSQNSLVGKLCSEETNYKRNIVTQTSLLDYPNTFLQKHSEIGANSKVQDYAQTQTDQPLIDQKNEYSERMYTQKIDLETHKGLTESQMRKESITDSIKSGDHKKYSFKDSLRTNKRGCEETKSINEKTKQVADIPTSQTEKVQCSGNIQSQNSNVNEIMNNDILLAHQTETFEASSSKKSPREDKIISFQFQQPASKHNNIDTSNDAHKSKISKCSCSCKSSQCQSGCAKQNVNDTSSDEQFTSQKSSSDSKNDPILTMIQEITKRYSKKDVDKNKKKKCLKEIITILSYLLDTDESTDNQVKTPESSTCGTDNVKSDKNVPDKRDSRDDACQTIQMVDIGVSTSSKKSKSKQLYIESSDIPNSTEVPFTSSDSATCKVLDKIKKECEKYHQKRCKNSHAPSKKCEASSSTSVNCDKCNRTHHCTCRAHKCKGQKTKSAVEKIRKKCVAYNLIIQTSDSIVNEENPYNNCRTIPNVIVKVPSKRKHLEKLPFKEVERELRSPRGRNGVKTHRSRSLPNDSEISSADERARQAREYTVKDYLLQNRPDFVEQCEKRQNCLRIISESRATERATHRELLSLQLEHVPSLAALSDTDLRRLAERLGVELRDRKPAPKFISEREMKKHSEKIYKSLPEVVQKKEDLKKQKIKKTNLLMANIFKKNLQKKTLRGSVNLSNYSTVIKI